MFTTAFSCIFTYQLLFKTIITIVYICLTLFTRVYLYSLVFTYFTCVYLYSSLFTIVHLCSFVFSYVWHYLCVNVYIFLCMFTLVYLCLLVFIVRFSWVDTESKLVVNVIWHQWYLLRTHIQMRNNHLLIICKWYSFMTNSWCHRNIMAVCFDLLLETRWEPSRAPRTSKFCTDFWKNPLCSYTKFWFASCRNREVIRGGAGVFSTEMDYTHIYPCLLVFNYVYICLPFYTCLFVFTYVYLCFSFLSYVYTSLIVFSIVYMIVSMYVYAK